jgi:hypothetical protein
MDSLYSINYGCYRCKLSCKIYNKIYWLVLFSEILRNKKVYFLVEESFAALIGIIFIYEAFDKMIEINHQRPVRLHTDKILPSNCSCIISNRRGNESSPITINVQKK